jgi:hypothetical protein
VDPDTYLRVTALMTHRSQELPKRTIDTSDYCGQRRHIEGALPLRVSNIRSENDEIQIGPACRSLVNVLRLDCSTHVNCMISIAQLQVHLHSRVGHVLEETPLPHVKPVRLGEVKTEGVNAHLLLGDALEDRESGQVLRAVVIVEVDDHAESVVLGVSESSAQSHSEVWTIPGSCSGSASRARLCRWCRCPRRLLCSYVLLGSGCQSSPSA